MSSPYPSPWQGSTHSLHDTQYRPPQSNVIEPKDYPVYPPKSNYSDVYSNQYPSHPPFSASRQPHKATVGTILRGRTPSPTPSEQKELTKGAFDWKAMSNWRYWIRKDWIWYYVALVVILVLVALMTLYHKQIVDWLTPVTRWLHDLSFGWIVPIAVLFIISFPPLFGHEIVAVLCGLVWGLWIGFAIVAAGTFLGEVGNFYAFKYLCRSRGEKLEREKISYACLARVVRDGGFKIALIARLSAIPGHFTTAIFSTCGMGIIVFSLAAILSLPKQFITVYLGVILEQSATGTTDKKSRIISDVVLAVTTLITILAMWYILRKMNIAKPAVIYARRKARQAKLERQQAHHMGHRQEASLNTISTDYNYDSASESEVPLTSRAMPMGYAPAFPEPKHFQDPSSESTDEIHLHAPRPQRADRRMPELVYENELALSSSDPLRNTSRSSSESPHGSRPQSHGPFHPMYPGTTSDTPYDPDPMNSPYPRSEPRISSPNATAPATSRPSQPQSPLARHLYPQHIVGVQGSSSVATEQTPNPYLSNPVVSPPDAPTSQRGDRTSEESYDYVQTTSPEPMVRDNGRPRASKPSSVHQGSSDARVQPPHLQDRHLPPDYAPQQR